MKNYYNILGVSDTATLKTISEAYKKLAQKFHPDRNPGDEFFASWFKEINEAKQILTNKEERAEYDFKLFNYLDAYELLKQQHTEENFRRSQGRNTSLRSRMTRQKWWMSGILAAIIITTFFILNEDENDRANNNTELFFDVAEPATKDLNPPPSSITLDTHISKVAAEQKQSITVDPIKGETSKSNSHYKKVNAKVQPGQRVLTNDEIEEIFQKLAVVKGSNAVQVIHSAKGNIKSDFAIVPLLQQHGYTIAGRKITVNFYNGVEVSSQENIIKLTIGTLGL
jgi:DnaJ-domain-containing protein 1